MRLLIVLLAAVTVALAGAVLASVVSPSGWVSELLASLRLLLVLAATLSGLATLAVGRRILGGGALVVAAVGAFTLLPSDTGGEGVSGAGGRTLRIMAFNMQGRSTDMAAFARLLEAERPDAVVLTEVVPQHARLFATLRRDWPYQESGGYGGIFDTVVVSRRPMTLASIDVSVHASMPITTVAICPDGAAGACLALTALHAPPPLFGPTALAWRNAHLMAAGATIGARPERWRVLAGDLNMTPWSPDYTALLRAARLRDAGIGLGLEGSWPTWLPRWLGIRIDHLLVSDRVDVLDVRLGPEVGSDHRAVIADLRLVD